MQPLFRPGPGACGTPLCRSGTLLRLQRRKVPLHPQVVGVGGVPERPQWQFTRGGAPPAAAFRTGTLALRLEALALGRGLLAPLVGRLRLGAERLGLGAGRLGLDAERLRLDAGRLGLDAERLRLRAELFSLRAQLLQVALRVVAAAADLAAPRAAKQGVENVAVGPGHDAVGGVSPQPQPNQHRRPTTSRHRQLHDPLLPDLKRLVDPPAARVGAHERHEPLGVAQRGRPRRQPMQAGMARGERHQQPEPPPPWRVQLEDQLLMERLPDVADEAAGQLQLRQHRIDLAPVQAGTHQSPGTLSRKARASPSPKKIR